MVFCLALLSLSAALSGCAACRPLKGVPARYLPEELKGCSRENRQMIDLSYLRQQAPAEYLVDSGDVLAIYIERVLGQQDQPPINQPLDPTRPPTLGYPLTVRDDGTLSLPLIQPIPVRGKTIPQIERDIRYAYTIGRRLLPPGQDRVLVTLHRPRQHRILVIRQEAQSDFLSGVSVSTSSSVSGGSLGSAKRGTGHVVSLPAYRNDVLNALVESGGMPGLDAENVVYVMRARRAPKSIARPPQPQPPAQQPQPGPAYGGQRLPPVYRPQPGFPLQQPGPIRQPGIVPLQGRAPIQGTAPMRGGASGGQLLQPGYGPVSAHSPSDGNKIASPADKGLIVRAQSPDMVHVPPTRNSNSGIQLVDYRISAAPRQFAENLTGIPMPPRPPRTRSPLRQAFHQVAGSGVGRAVQAPFQRLIGGGVSQAECSTCQTAPMQMGIPQMAPQYAPQMAQPYPQQMPMQQFSPPQQQQWQPPANWSNARQIAGGNICNQQNSTRIPLELEAYEAVNFSERDIILEDGDIVFIASRDNELFYTGGLLGGGEYTLPRDRDLDILEAIAIAESNSNGGDAAGSSALNGDVSISPSEAVILRKLPNGSQVSILVNLYRARTRPSERINIQPGDYIIVQYTKMEAFGAFIERHILESALFGVAGAQLSTGGR